MRALKINPPHRLKVIADPKDITRFLAMVAVETAERKRGIGPCWIWLGHKDGKGYGQFRFKGKSIWTHRFAYALFRGTIPNLAQIDHKCCNPSCVNPWHGKRSTMAANYSRANRERNLEPAPF